MFGIYIAHSPLALYLRPFNVAPETFQSFIDKYGIPADEQIQYPWQDSRIQQLFDDSGFKETLWQHVMQQRAL